MKENQAFKVYKEEIEKRVRIDSRRSSKYSIGAMFMSILYGVFLGYLRSSQMDVLSNDRVFQKVARLIGFPVQSTIKTIKNGVRIIFEK